MLSLPEALLSGRSLIVLAGFAVLAMLEPVLERRLADRLHASRAWEWSWEYVASPLLRTLLVVLFVLAAYPVLFGVLDAPGIDALIAGGHARFNTLLNAVFVLTLLLPALPLLNRHPEWVLPAQGMLAAAIVFHWYADYLGADRAGPWPDTVAMLLILAMAWLLHRLAQLAAGLLGEWFDSRAAVQGSRQVLLNGLELLAQGPIILAYGHALGRQIAM